MFELNQLRSFIAVATELNFRRAAQRLNMTQPPLSRQIQMLEREIGVLLFDRGGRNTTLTAAGRSFFAEAQDILRRAESAILSARRAETGEEGGVVLGFIPVAALGIVPEVIDVLRQFTPNINVALKEMLTVDQVEALPSGLIHLGIMRLPRDRSQLNIVRLKREPYVLAIHKNNPLAFKEQFVIEDLHLQDFLMYAPTAGWYSYESINSLFITSKVRPNFLQYFSQSLTMMSVVNAGIGMALVPESSKDLGFSNVLLKPIELPTQTAAEHYLAWSRASVELPVAQRVREALMDAFDTTPID